MDDNQNTLTQDGGNGSTTTTTPSQSAVDWEARYKGLQTAQQNKQKQLQQQIDDLTTANEQARLEAQQKQESLKTFETQQAQFLKEKADLESKLQTASAELDKTNKRVIFQKVILAEFPDLAIMADYIPPADTEEGIRANAQAFKANMQKYVEVGVKDTLKGASPAPAGTGNTIVPNGELDALWKKVYASAGVSGKEEEFAKANKELQDYLARQKS